MALSPTQSPSATSYLLSSIKSIQYDPSMGDPNCIVCIFDKKTRKEICHYYLHHDAIDLTNSSSATQPTKTTANFTALAPIDLTASETVVDLTQGNSRPSSKTRK